MKSILLLSLLISQNEFVSGFTFPKHTILPTRTKTVFRVQSVCNL